MNAPVEPEIAPSTVTLITRAANEGIPIAAIARVFKEPFELVSDVLQLALSLGRIGTMPKPDWPPTARWADRLPSVPRSANADDVEFQCRKAFKLTALEAGFMMVLLRYECAEKEKLHNVIEQHRQMRQARPSNQELTDPKMVDVMICKLRKKLKAVNPEFKIDTSWGKGYYFEPAIKQQIFAQIGGPYACGPEAQRASDPGTAA